MDVVSRCVELADGVKRHAADNSNTRVSGSPSPAGRSARPEGVESLESCFNRVHWDLYKLASQRSQLGCLAAVVHESLGIVAHGWVVAGPQPRVLRVGRHGSVDLHVPFDASLSLRHLLLIVRAHGSGMKVRVLDLSSGLGITDELGRKIAGCEVDGFVGFRAARLTVFLCPTGHEVPWNPRAIDPWATLPARIYQDHFLGQRSRAEVPAVLAHQTLIERFTRPPTTVGDPSSSDTPMGHLEVLDGQEPLLLPVGSKALQQGVLIGRDGRCSGARIITDCSVSRVHLLLLRLDGDVLAIDAGSSNGTYYQGQAIHCSAVQAGDVIFLGSCVRVRWLPFDAKQRCQSARSIR